jgi:hypothetical protein
MSLLTGDYFLTLIALLLGRKISIRRIRVLSERAPVPENPVLWIKVGLRATRKVIPDVKRRIKCNSSALFATEPDSL